MIAVNTMLASASGAFASFLVTKFRFGKPDISMICNGMLAGLVAITAPCAFVSSWAAILIGAIAGVLVIYAVLFVERRLRIDDPVGAVAVHGVNGAFGVLALGLFANGTYGEGTNGVAGTVTGLLYGDSGQFVASCIGVIANILWVAPVTFIALKVIDKLVGNRVPAEDEDAGLDIPEMGVAGYATETGTPVLVEPAAAPGGTEAIASALVAEGAA